MNFKTMTRQRKLILIAAAVGIISMFLPWRSFGYGSINGMYGWGALVLLCFLAAGTLSVLGDETKNLSQPKWRSMLAAGGVASLIMIVKFLEAMKGALNSLSIGFYGALAASLGIVAFAYLFRSETDSLLRGWIKSRSSQRSETTPPAGKSTTKIVNPSNDPTKPVA